MCCTSCILIAVHDRTDSLFFLCLQGGKTQGLFLRKSFFNFCKTVCIQFIRPVGIPDITLHVYTVVIFRSIYIYLHIYTYQVYNRHGLTHSQCDTTATPATPAEQLNTALVSHWAPEKQAVLLCRGREVLPVRCSGRSRGWGRPLLHQGVTPLSMLPPPIKG